MNGEPADYVVTEAVNDPEFICTNRFNARNFIVEKVVTGNMGSRDMKFPFETRITGLDSGAEYHAFITTDPTLKEEDVEEADLLTYTADSNGELLADYRLAHGQYWKILNLPVDAVTETKGKVSVLSAYTFHWQYRCKENEESENWTTVDSESFMTDTENVTMSSDVNNPVIICKILAEHVDSTLICTNDRTTLVPTGLIDHLWTVVIPIAAGIAAIAFGFCMSMTRSVCEWELNSYEYGRIKRS